MKKTDLLESFRTFIRDRENTISRGVSLENTELIFDRVISTTLQKGSLTVTLSKQDRVKFMGEVFALSVYDKKHNIQDWVYEPNVDELHPDFSIDKNSTYIEIYSPIINKDKNGHEYYLQKDSKGNYARKNITKSVKVKSKKYKNCELIIIVHVVTGDFVTDLVKSLANVRLQNEKHKIYLYHGDNEHKIENNQ